MTVQARLKGVARDVIPRVVEAVPGLAARFRRGLHVFTFHEVAEEASPFQAANALCTPPALFRSQLDWIESCFRVVDPCALVEDDATVGDGAAVITFDDGWRGIFECALPELERRGLPSIVFVTMAPIATGEPDLSAAAAWLAGPGGLASWPTPQTIPLDRVAPLAGSADYLRFQGEVVDPATLADWGRRPLVAIGSHLYRHWNVAGLDVETLRREVDGNVDALSDIPGAVPLFAFPFGKRGIHFTDAQAAAVLERGAARVFSSDARGNELPLGRVVDRVSLTPSHLSPASCWWSAHQHRLREVSGRR